MSKPRMVAIVGAAPGSKAELDALEDVLEIPDAYPLVPVIVPTGAAVSPGQVSELARRQIMAAEVLIVANTDGQVPPDIEAVVAAAAKEGKEVRLLYGPAELGSRIAQLVEEVRIYKTAAKAEGGWGDTWVRLLRAEAAAVVYRKALEKMVGISGWIADEAKAALKGNRVYELEAEVERLRKFELQHRGCRTPTPEPEKTPTLPQPQE